MVWYGMVWYGMVWYGTLPDAHLEHALVTAGATYLLIFNTTSVTPANTHALSFAENVIAAMQRRSDFSPIAFLHGVRFNAHFYAGAAFYAWVTPGTTWGSGVNNRFGRLYIMVDKRQPLV